VRPLQLRGRRAAIAPRPGALTVTSGGARSRSGPAPNPNALRRDRDEKDWIALPAAGRDGPTPDWPSTRPTTRERALWEREWRRPQAIMWERNGQELEVAIYVRTLVEAERRRVPTGVRTLLRQQQEALGLSLPGLLRNRWRIEDSAPARKELAATGTEQPSARERLKSLNGQVVK